MRPLLRIPVVPAVALAVGALWWWAVLRLLLVPAESGAVEGAVAVGGWGLGLLPVHCVPAPVRRLRRSADGSGRTAAAPGASPLGVTVTRASTPHRSGEGSGPS
ncbi:hypothetical protein ACIPRL_19875 [Streptomyces sp. NPDC090085]|uniref:hypothetical protein n=1 Tax=unclassified Streptomyces TaxID=2593676 RepID=UPI0036E4D7E6